MAVNSITFGGVNSADFGIYISGEGVFNAPKRDVEMIAIPGRNGELALDKGRFENIEVTYPAFNFEPNDYETFAKNLSDFRNAICSLRGYQRLTDTFHPDEYRMAAYIGGLEIKPIKYNTASEFSIIFDCKPQRYLTDGETPITLGEWGETETVSGDIVEIENDGIEAVKSLSVELEPIQDLHGYDKPWAGGAGKNLFGGNDGTFAIGSQGRSLIVKNGRATYHVGSTMSSSTMLTESALSAHLANKTLKAGTYTFSLVSNLQDSALVTNATLNLSDGTSVRNGDTFTLTADADITTMTSAGAHQYSAGDYTFDVQIESGSSASAWTPYSNICPIYGRTECVTEVSGANLFDEASAVVYRRFFLDEGSNNYSWHSSSDSGSFAFSCEPNTTYTVSCDNSAITIFRVGYINVDPSELEPSDAPRMNGVVKKTASGATTITTGANAKAIVVQINNSLVTARSTKTQIEVGSSASAYEPYQGTTYTTTLGRTVYGGAVDVVSGVLNVTHAMVDLGTLAWAYNPNIPWFYSWTDASSRKPTPTADVANVWSSDYKVYSRDVLISTDITGICIDPNGNVVIRDSRFTDATAFKTAVSGVQLCYELAQPQTYQLTGQDIELIEGNNYIWSDSGDVTVEHGQNPNYLVNPTRFESSPLLMVEGYGTIGFNGYEIELEDAVVGEIDVLSRATANNYATGASRSMANAELINEGDTISLSLSHTFSVRAVLGSSQARYAEVNQITSITNSLTDASSTYEIKRTANGANLRYVKVTTDFPTFEFAFGTSSTQTNRAVIVGSTIDARQTVVNFSQQYLDTVVSYNADTNKISWTISMSHASGEDELLKIGTTTTYDKNSMTSSATADSTKNLLGHPTYVDCDLGEAYRIDGGETFSLNRYIDLGSDLPKLAVGANEVVVDDTITELKIEPRWWRI